MKLNEAIRKAAKVLGSAFPMIIGILILVRNAKADIPNSEL